MVVGPEAWRRMAVLALVAALGPGSAACHRRGSTAGFKDGVYAASATCRPCHADIHRAWAESLHARAGANPRFTVAHREYLGNPWMRAGGGPDLCLRCHLPAAVAGNGGPSEQGIGCDYCHSIREVRMEQEQPVFRVTPGTTKYGPLAESASPAHEAERRDFFRRSEVCAGCHELWTPGGTPILSTYSEWQRSPQRHEGRQCQHCHMPDVLGTPAAARLTRRPGALVNSHRAPGGHSPDQLRRAFTIEMLQAKREGAGAVLDLALTNTGAAHDLPTGMPSRTIVLGVEVVDHGAVVAREERTYRRRLLDAAGAPIVHDSRVFVAAAKLGSDNRLRAGERRVEHFALARAGSPAAMLRVRLTYTYSPSPGVLPPVTVPFFTIERRLGSGR